MSKKTENPSLIKRKILSWNIDTNVIRVEEGFAHDSHPQWRVANRMESVKKTLGAIIESNHPEIIQIQEGRNFTNKHGENVDSVTPVVEFLRSQGYEVLERYYNGYEPKEGDNRSFKYITAYDPRRLTHVQSSSRYFNMSGDQPTFRDFAGAAQKENDEEIKRNNFGAFWERGTFINEFYDHEANSSIYAMNVHLDMIQTPQFGKIQDRSAALLEKFTQEILEKHRQENSRKDSAKQTPEPKILITGDFNAFPNVKTGENIDVEQLQHLFEDATKAARFPDGSPANYSFIPFPHEFLRDNTVAFATKELREKFEKMSPAELKAELDRIYKEEGVQSAFGLLDRVFLHGVRNVECRVMPFGLFEELQGYTKEIIHEYVARHLQDGPAFASDHQPVLTEFEIPENIVKPRVAENVMGAANRDGAGIEQ